MASRFGSFRGPIVEKGPRDSPDGRPEENRGRGEHEGGGPGGRGGMGGGGGGGRGGAGGGGGGGGGGCFFLVFFWLHQLAPPRIDHLDDRATTWARKETVIAEGWEEGKCDHGCLEERWRSR